MYTIKLLARNAKIDEQIYLSTAGKGLMFSLVCLFTGGEGSWLNIGKIDIMIMQGEGDSHPSRARAPKNVKSSVAIWNIWREYYFDHSALCCRQVRSCCASLVVLVSKRALPIFLFFF